MQDITVVQYTVNDEGKYTVSLDLTSPLAMNTSGLALLVQKVVMWLLKTPGRDYFEPELGGGFLQLTRPQMVDEGRDMIESNIIDAIAAVEQQMKARQLGVNRPLEEKLQSLGLRKVNGILSVEDDRGFMINIDLKNMAGQRAEFVVPVITEEASDA